VPCKKTCEIDLNGTHGCNGKVILEDACSRAERSTKVSVEGCNGLMIKYFMDDRDGAGALARGSLDIMDAQEHVSESFSVSQCKYRSRGKPPLGNRCHFRRELCDVVPKKVGS
jgi:hypothetical protein